MWSWKRLPLDFFIKQASATGGAGGEFKIAAAED
jgi:hypothetical protein